MMTAAMPMADPRLEFHWLPDPGFLIQGFLIQCPRRTPPDLPRPPDISGAACSNTLFSARVGVPPRDMTATAVQSRALNAQVIALSNTTRRSFL